MSGLSLHPKWSEQRVVSTFSGGWLSTNQISRWRCFVAKKKAAHVAFVNLSTLGLPLNP